MLCWTVSRVYGKRLEGSDSESNWAEFKRKEDYIFSNFPPPNNISFSGQVNLLNGTSCSGRDRYNSKEEGRVNPNQIRKPVLALHVKAYVTTSLYPHPQMKRMRWKCTWRDWRIIPEDPLVLLFISSNRRLELIPGRTQKQQIPQGLFLLTKFHAGGRHYLILLPTAKNFSSLSLKG